MLPPDDHARAFAQLLADLRAGRVDPEQRLSGSNVPLSTFVRVNKTREAVGALEPVLAHFGIDAADWSKAEAFWRGIGYVLEVNARTLYWQETLDVGADVAEIRRKHAYR